MMEQFRAKFIEEATNLITTLETLLPVLEQNPGDLVLVEKVFRIMHTLKGNSRMFGFEQMGEIAHCLENLYSSVKQGTITISPGLLTLTAASLAHFKLLIISSSISDNNDAHQQMMQQLAQFVNQPAGQKATSEPKPNVDITKESLGSASTYHIAFKPKQDIFANGTNPLYLLDELHDLGDCTVTVLMAAIPALQNLDIDKCYTHWEIYLTGKISIEVIKEVFIFAENECTLEIHEMDTCKLVERT